jgi:hypothetical protein
MAGFGTNPLARAYEFVAAPKSWTSSSVGTFESSGPPNVPDDALRRIREEALFSKHFVLTYNFVPLDLLFLIAHGHWTLEVGNWYRRYRQQQRSTKDVNDGNVPSLNNHEELSSSSGSSTLEGTYTLHRACSPKSRMLPKPPL